MKKVETSLSPIRNASPEDTDLVADILGQAFAADPVMAWINHQPGAWARYYFHSIARHFLIGHGMTYLCTLGERGVAPENSGNGESNRTGRENRVPGRNRASHGAVMIGGDAFAGAAMWLPPQVSMRAFPVFPLLSMLWHVLATAGIIKVARTSILGAFLEFFHIRKPHYYLHAIGVRPEASGQGIGSLLLQEVLQQCDAQRIPAYLENTNAKNLPIYEIHGFKVMREIHLPNGGPSFWPMIREPR